MDIGITKKNRSSKIQEIVFQLFHRVIEILSEILSISNKREFTKDKF